MNKGKSGIVFSLVAIAILGVLVFCITCNSGETRATGFYMDTYVECTLYGRNSGEAKVRIENMLDELDRLFDVTNQDSDVSKINAGAGEFVEVSEHTSYVISEAKKIGELTGRALDITIYPVVKAWGFTTGENRVPGPEELSTLVKTVDVSQIETDGNFVKIPEGFMIDLGSVAKGYASNLLRDLCKNAGVKRAIIDFGGNIVCIGSKSVGKDWHIGIQSPYEDRNVPAYVSVSDKAVVTSGLYERFFEKDGVRYGHIMDPFSGYPVDNGLVSVTIIADDGLLADSLSTAIFVGGEELAVKLRDTLDFEYVLFYGHGDVKVSDDIDFSYIVK